jgi:4-amino-4-deoxy-L-arabinose transferase-like glycosyltransferase
MNRYLLLLILLMGAALRFHALGQDRRFHPDEALYSTFARNAALNGDWLLHGALDKPPLTLYTSALSMTLFAVRIDERGLLNFDMRQGELAARLPNTFANILLVAVMHALAKSLYHDKRIALLSALFIALSPFAVAFSATAFTDVLMLLFMTIALWMAAAGRWGWSGIWLTLAFLSKPQGLFYLPLVITTGWALNRLTVRDSLRFGVILMLGTGGLFLWDIVRGQTTSLWMLGYVNSNPERVIRADEVVPRLVRWLNIARTMFGAPTAIFALAIPFSVVVRIVRSQRQKSTMIDVLQVTFVLSYLLLHWLVAFNTYDRYFLPLLPPLSLLAARGSVWLWRTLSRYILSAELALAAGAIVFTLVVSAFEASEQRLPFSDRNGSFPNYEGIDQLADFLNQQSLGAIIYDHWLNWELGFYMGQWSDKRRVYYPTPASLAEDALLQTDPAPRFFPAPAQQPIAPWLEALHNAGFSTTIAYQTSKWVVYEIIRDS